MLSTTDMHITTATLGLADLNSQMTNQFAYVARLEQDGFITFDFSSSNVVSISDFAVPSAVLSSGALRDLITHGTTVAGIPGSIELFDSAGFGFNTIRPAIIVEDSDGGFQLLRNQMTAENADSGVYRSEGGSISIKSILEELPSTGEQAPTLLAAMSPGVSNEQQRPTASPAQKETIAGELERAIVFEMAGGDPVGIVTPVSRGGGDFDPAFGDDLKWRDEAASPSRDAHQQSMERLRNGVVEAQHESRPPESNAQAVPSLVGPTSFGHADYWQENPSNARGLFSATAVGDLDPLVTPTAIGSDEASDPVYAEAFGQLGADEKTSTYSFVKNASRRAAGAIPLLVLLALERIAARNSRRTNREFADVSGRPPRRPLAPGDNGPEREI